MIDYNWPGLKPAAMRVSHGTHVMGLATGYQPGTKDNTRPIICVQLPTDLTMDVSGAQILPALGRAIDFIKIHAERFRLDTNHGKRIPLVVNFSFGNFAGPHDGTGLIEAKIDHELHSTTQREIQVALPAGNGNLARTHAEITFTDEDTGNVRPASLDWRIQPDDRSASYVEIWMPPKENPDNLVRVRVTPPWDRAVRRFQQCLERLRSSIPEITWNSAGSSIPLPTRQPGAVALSSAFTRPFITTSRITWHLRVSGKSKSRMLP